MASSKRLLKERNTLARNPIPYVIFNEEADDDSMTDTTSDLRKWRFVLVLDPAHDSLEEVAAIGKASDSPYCNPPPSVKRKSLMSGAMRAAKLSKKSAQDKAGQQPGEGMPAYFAFELDFPANYPFKPPVITVLSDAYHPNIKKDTGAICDDVLTGEGWGPTLNVRKICARLRKFLCEPDPGHPLENNIAGLLEENPLEYSRAAFEHAVEHATRSKAEAAVAKGGQRK